MSLPSYDFSLQLANGLIRELLVCDIAKEVGALNLLPSILISYQLEVFQAIITTDNSNNGDSFSIL